MPKWKRVYLWFMVWVSALTALLGLALITLNDNSSAAMVGVTACLTEVFLVAASAAALAAIEKRRWVVPAVIGLVLAASAALMLPAIWGAYFLRASFENFLPGGVLEVTYLIVITLAVAAGVFCIVPLLMTRPLRLPLMVLPWLAGTGAAVIAIVLLGSFWQVVSFNELFGRIFYAAIIVFVEAGILCFVFTRFLKFGLRKRTPVTLGSGRIKIECPRCLLHQEVGQGESRCARCRLYFKLTMEEPRCGKCGYPLHGLTRPVCPECGQNFDAVELATEPPAKTSAG